MHCPTINHLASIIQLLSIYYFPFFNASEKKSLKNKKTTKTSFLSDSESLVYADRETILQKKFLVYERHDELVINSLMLNCDFNW